jgi:NADPH:quinone reductase-like Zn-dependent oxidoreductase
VQGIEVGMRVATCCLDSFKTFVRINYRAVARIPDSVSFPVAAAIPVNYTTAWHSFHDVARVQPGETVLIHSGAGGTGQAAIQVAQYLGATIFATVGTEEKKQWLMQRYKIPDTHIFSSRDITFAQSIKRLTSGRGVDVVLNSLSGEGLAASWECIAPYGRFIEIGKRDIFTHNKLQMFQFAKNVTFRAVDIAGMNVDQPVAVRKAMQSIFALVESGVFTASEPLHVYGVSEIERAFRGMQIGKSFGKAVVELRVDDYVEVSDGALLVLSML